MIVIVIRDILFSGNHQSVIIYEIELPLNKPTLYLDVTIPNQSCWQMNNLVLQIQALQILAINSGVLIQ